MSTTTHIEWTDSTWNPIRGCSRVSEGCRNCYAERVAYRFSGVGRPYEGLARKVNGHPSWTGKVELVEKHLLDPLNDSEMKKPVFIDCRCNATVRDTCMHGSKLSPDRWRPRRIFVNSMSDLFHPAVPDEWIDRIFAVMALCPQHTFQILTKRPERMLAYFEVKDRATTVMHAADIISSPEIRPGVREILYSWHGWPLPNVQLGVSVEDQKTADERIPLLLQTPAAVRFLSAEPLLGSVDLTNVMDRRKSKALKINCVEAKEANPAHSYLVETMGADYPYARLDWVICGGESGPGARPMHPDWARGLRDQCVAAGVPFFFKQWGEWRGAERGDPDFLHPNGGMRQDGSVTRWPDRDEFGDDPLWSIRVGKKAAGSLLDGREWKEFPR